MTTSTAEEQQGAVAAFLTRARDETDRALERALGRKPQLLGDPGRALRRIAWCSGGAQDYFEQAVATGADCFVSGEISEQNVHMARESGIPYIAAGHHATERYGVQAVGAELKDKLGLQVEYIDIDNPV